MTENEDKRDPLADEQVDEVESGSADEEDAPSSHLLSRDEILDSPDDTSSGKGKLRLDIAAINSILAASTPKLPKMPSSLFQSHGADVAKLTRALQMPSIEVPPIPENPQVRLQRGILDQQKAQNEVLVTMLAESQRAGRQTTWILRLTAFSAVVAVVAIVLTIIFGFRTEPTSRGAAPAPSPGISRSATP